jgi:hypothetical protein
LYLETPGRFSSFTPLTPFELNSQRSYPYIVETDKTFLSGRFHHYLEIYNILHLLPRTFNEHTLTKIPTNMMYTSISLLALVGAVQAHMSMFYPPPLGAAPSINRQSTNIDKEFNFPLGCCGADGGPSEPSPGLCRGHLDKFDTEDASVTWQAGQDAYFQLTDHSYDPDAPGSTHYGGSCQVGFSVDKGKTWKVAASYHGACPLHTEDGSPEAQTFDFKVPNNMPEGDAIFAWVWLNREHEAFMNCAKVNIGGGSGSPAQPSKPSQSATTPKPPSQSYGAQPKPSQAPAKPEQPEDEEESAPAPSDGAEEDEGAEDNQGSEDSEEDEDAEDNQGSEDSEEDKDAEDNQGSEDSEEGSEEGSDYSEGSEETEGSDNTDASEESSNKPWWADRPHREVKEGVRRYNVDGHSCECRREPLSSRCYCDSSASSEKRAVIEKKALRMHRRTLYKRVDACDWTSAPAMEVSYFTSDASCAPNAKMLTPESDDFELGWDVSCGVVEGDGEYKIKMMDCSMYGA